MLALAAACAVACSAAAQSATTPQPETAQSLRRQAVALVYQHEHDEAARLMRRAIALAPDDVVAHRTLATVLWLKMLFLRGAVTVDHYLGSFSRPQVDLRKPPPELEAEFKTQVAKALELAERQVAERPRDARAHYELGAAVGLQATFTASIEGRLLAGFRGASRAYDEHEKALQLDPGLKDAQLIVGTYRYIVSTLSLPMRWMAYAVGFGGGKERGMRMIEETASAGDENRIDAQFALVLLYNREKRYEDALRVLQDLRREHRRNRLVVLEAGSTAVRAGRFEQADTLLTEGMAMLAATTGPKIPGEEALWAYKRGAARVGLGRTAAAEADLGRAIAADAPTWVQGRARVELSRLALKRGDRPTAAREARQAQTLCSNDPPCLDEAKKLLRTTDGR
jgi:tetratricopeptide (TPR) repeat protein